MAARTRPVLSLQHCYPSKGESKKLLWGDLKFPILNSGFSLFLGLVFVVLGFTWSLLPRTDVAVIEFAILAAGLVGYTGYQEKFSGKVVGLSLLHAIVQFAAMFALTKLWMRLDSMLFGFHSNGPWWAWLFEIGILMGVVGGAVAGLVFGINLMLTCRFADINHNDAFSAMRLNSFRNFLRIRLLGNQVTVYPIGLDSVPKRDQWIDNPESASNPRASWFVSQTRLETKAKLLEPAIVVGGLDVSPAAATVKKPSELPRE